MIQYFINNTSNFYIFDAINQQDFTLISNISKYSTESTQNTLFNCFDFGKISSTKTFNDMDKIINLLKKDTYHSDQILLLEQCQKNLYDLQQINTLDYNQLLETLQLGLNNPLWENVKHIHNLHEHTFKNLHHMLETIEFTLKDKAGYTDIICPNHICKECVFTWEHTFNNQNNLTWVTFQQVPYLNINYCKLNNIEFIDLFPLFNNYDLTQIDPFQKYKLNNSSLVFNNLKDIIFKFESNKFLFIKNPSPEILDIWMNHNPIFYYMINASEEQLVSSSSNLDEKYYQWKLIKETIQINHETKPKIYTLSKIFTCPEIGTWYIDINNILE